MREKRVCGGKAGGAGVEMGEQVKVVWCVLAEERGVMCRGI